MISGAHQLDNEMSSTDVQRRDTVTKAIITRTCTVCLWVQRVVLRLRMKAGRRHFGGGETIIQSISRQGEEYERAAASCCVGVMMQYAHPPHSFEAVKACGSVITFYPTRSAHNLTPPHHHQHHQLHHHVACSGE